MRKYYIFDTKDLKFKKDNYPTIIFFLMSIVFLTLIALTIFTSTTKEIQIIEKAIIVIVPDSTQTLMPTDHDKLIQALIYVESRGRDSIVNHTSGATGCLQLLPIMVKDVNRILKKTGADLRYTLKDRLSRTKSIEMFHIWRLFYHRKHSFEVISRCWYGGSKGYLMPSTLGYWHKVKTRLRHSPLQN